MCEEARGSSDISLFSPSHLFGFPACANGSGLDNSYVDLCLNLKKVDLRQQSVREPCLQRLCCIGNEEGFFFVMSPLFQNQTMEKELLWLRRDQHSLLTAYFN